MGKAGEKQRIDPERLRVAMDAAGIKGDADLGRKVGVGRGQPAKWRGTAAQHTTPSGDTLNRLCNALGVLPGYLFGAPDLGRAQVIMALRRQEAEPEAAIVEAMGPLSVEERRELSARVLGWIERGRAERREPTAAEVQTKNVANVEPLERPAPTFPGDLDADLPPRGTAPPPTSVDRPSTTPRKVR